MKAKVTLFAMLILLLPTDFLYSQDRFSKDDSLSIEEILQKSPRELHMQRVRERMEYLDSLIALDSLNFKAINQKINQLILSYDSDSAKSLLHQFHRKTLNTTKYDFLKATLFEHFKDYDTANSLYMRSHNEIKSEFKDANTDTEKAEALLGLWYMNKYLGDEAKADSLSGILRTNYYQSINVGISWYYFYRRFGDGVFEEDFK